MITNCRYDLEKNGEDTYKHDFKKSNAFRPLIGTRKEDGIPPVGIKVLREREKRLLLDFIRDNLKQPKKRRKE